MIEIDGSFGSGGGQILRTACALATVTKKPCHIFNIRVKRPKTGLMRQHLLGLQALAQLCGGRLEGDELGSEEIKFYPGEIYKEQIAINIPTAASITLILQALIPPALFAPSTIKISFNGGATDTFFSPTIDYFRYVFLKTIETMGAKVEISILKRGYYPEGKAGVNVKVSLSKLKNLNFGKKGAQKNYCNFRGLNYSKEKKGGRTPGSRSKRSLKQIQITDRRRSWVFRHLLSRKPYLFNCRV
jgi:RNA 3'-phosphate cyclase